MALNERLLLLIRAAFKELQDADPSLTKEAVATASGIPAPTFRKMFGESAGPVTAAQAVRLAIAFGIDPKVWFDELRSLAKELGARKVGERDQLAAKRAERQQPKIAKPIKRAARKDER